MHLQVPSAAKVRTYSPLFFLLLFVPVNTSSHDDLRDLLIGASHAINHVNQESTLSSAKKGGSLGPCNPQQKQHRKPNDEGREKENYRRHMLSSTFSLLAETFGLAADAVRISGDTASGVLGSSIKLVGTAIKSTGSQFDNAGNWISPKNKRYKRQKQMSTSERLLHKSRFVHGSRSMAAQSVKLLGNVVQEFGDMLLFTGAATESIGSLTASVAEDSMRLLEDLAESIADSRSSKPQERKILVRPIRQSAVPVKPTVSYGSHEPSDDTEGTAEEMEYVHSTMSQTLLSMLGFLTQDTGGVPSQAPELFVVFALCYIATVLTFGGKQGTISQRVAIKQEPSHHSMRKTWIWYVIATAAIPIRIAFLLLQLTRHILFNRYTLLLFLYLLAWVQVCHMSQIRSRSIYSSAEARGLRFALSSLQEVKPSAREPTVWLNTLIQQIWRVPASDCPSYPDYVRDGIKGCKRDSVRDCVIEQCDIYGGLDPFLSWSIGDALISALDTSRVSRPRNIAFASLQSISLGRNPPTIRHIEVLGVSSDGRRTEYMIDFDLSLEDLRLVLEIKLSSLDFALLPTTKVAVGSLFTKGKLKVTVTSIPETPFLSTVQISLAHLLDCNIRITPLSDDRYVP